MTGSPQPLARGNRILDAELLQVRACTECLAVGRQKDGANACVSRQPLK